ncbi:hypothetical protein C1I95_07960 [Micromonospora craterilacus]|uniref:DUF4386 domain-containing protein n=1 Tax=Micromonospora craterilacus TaxID=1655439 RepID=A0A2W2EYE7_9ACTN|nr:hypothetical protein [Micromonospora craterilacus]PZG21285.1 hypothetical protein C1I95_07960 [Micromonospora craterilacus]
MYSPTLPEQPADSRPLAPVRQPRAWALTGTVGGLVGLVGIFATATLTAPAEQFRGDNAQYVAALAGTGYVWAHQVVTVVAIVCLAIFAAGLRRYLGAQEPAGSLVPMLAATGVGLVLVGLLIGGGISTELFFSLGSAEEYDPDVIAPQLTIFATMAWLWGGIGLTAGAVAVGGLRHGSVSRWFAVFSAVIALLVAATQLAPVQYIALVPGGIWVVVAGLALAFGQHPQTGRS